MNGELREEATITICKSALSDLLKSDYKQGWKEASELRQHAPERNNQ